MPIMSRGANGPRRRVPAAGSPPFGASLGSFVLFASLATVLALGYAAGEWWNLGGGFGFPTDAAWTRVVFARNVGSGDGLCFNPGTPVAGAPGPAWIACLAAVGFFVFDYVFAAKLLGVLSLILTAYLVWFITLDLLDDWRFAFLAAVVTAGSPRLMTAALDGTESALAALLLTATIYWQARSWQGSSRRRLLVMAAAGLAALCRPELLLILPLMLLDRGLVTARQSRPDRRLWQTPAGSLPEVAGAAVLGLPYVAYNWRAGGPLWQQPDLSLRTQPLFAWAAELLRQLWMNHPLVLCSAAVGLPVVILAVGRQRGAHPSYLLVLTPLTVLVAPGLLWRAASRTNAAYGAAYLIPMVSILGAAGLLLIYRAARETALRARERSGRIILGSGITVVVAMLTLFGWSGHSAAWKRHGSCVKKVSDLQGYIGRWTVQHLASDASIASREVGAIGFYSRRRVVDLGGTIDRAGLEALRRPGSPDTNLLDYLQKVRPSHLAIRPADFPDLSQRADLLAPVVTCGWADPMSGGVTTMTLYETPWPPLTVRAVRGQAARE